MKFIVLGNKNAIGYSGVFPLIKDVRIRIGATSMSGVSWMIMPDGVAVERGEHRVDAGRTIVKLQRLCWFTNLRHDVRRSLPPLKTMAENLATNRRLRKHLLEKYGRLEYPKYDNYDAIEVPFVEAIPSDYDGAMGVPITFLDKWEPDGAVEVLGCTESNGRGLSGNIWNGRGGCLQPSVCGRRAYSRLFVKPRFDVLGNFNGSSLEEKEAAGYVHSADAPCIVNGKEIVWNGPVVGRRPLYKRIVIKPRPEQE